MRACSTPPRRWWPGTRPPELRHQRARGHAERRRQSRHDRRSAESLINGGVVQIAGANCTLPSGSAGRPRAAARPGRCTTPSWSPRTARMDRTIRPPRARTRARRRRATRPANSARSARSRPRRPPRPRFSATRTRRWERRRPRRRRRPPSLPNEENAYLNFGGGPRGAGGDERLHSRGEKRDQDQHHQCGHLRVASTAAPRSVSHRARSSGSSRADEKPHGKAKFAIAQRRRTLPRVDIIYAHANMSRDLITSAVRNGAKGLVIAGVGDGNMTQEAVDALSAAAKQGVVVVRGTRLPGGSSCETAR